MDNISNKNILIMGMGKSGAACARFFKNRGASVTITDNGDEKSLGAYIPEMRELGIHLELGAHPPEIFESADMIILSPGVPHTLQQIIRAKEKNIPVMGEIELASRFIKEPVIAVTGTNGKTTSTTLLGEMLKKSGFSVFVGGNIGTPLIEYAGGSEKAERLVVEVSSFQLDTIEHFKPSTALLLNITEDHLDRYPDFTAYGRSKARIFENQTKEDTAVLNGADPFIRSILPEIKSRKLFFNPRENEEGIFIISERMICRTEDFMNVEFDMSKVNLHGSHNRENMAAACLAALSAGGSPEGIQSALNSFKGLPHRIEYAGTVDGVRYFDDSKATNVDAVVRALESFDVPIVLIMGGRGKKSDLSVLKNLIREKVKKLILMGETKEEIEKVLGHECRGGSEMASTMEDAVRRAHKAAEPGDVVLLSPSGSSFDMYTGYARRGEDFCRSVNLLKDECN